MDEQAAGTTKKKRKSPTPSTEEKPVVQVSRVVSTTNVAVHLDDDGKVAIAIRGVSDENTILHVAKGVAQQIAQCLKLFLGGKGTGTPRKK